MSAPTSLIEMLLNLLRDPAAMASFQEHPDSFLASCGMNDLSAADIHDAVILAQDSHEASFDRDFHTGNHVQLPPPPAAPHPNPGETDHQAAIRYLNNYVTNNYVDSHDTITDNSLNQNIDNRDGHFNQTIDTHSTVASGAGAVAAGGDIRDSTVTTGNGNVVGTGNAVGTGNVVGDGNQVVNGNHDTTSFGHGAATSTDVGGNVTVDHGAFASGGSATVDNSDNSTHLQNVGNTDSSVHDSGNSFTDASQHDVGNTDTHIHTEDSHDTETNIHTEDSHNTEIDHSNNQTDSNDLISVHNLI